MRPGPGAAAGGALSRSRGSSHRPEMSRRGSSIWDGRAGPGSVTAAATVGTAATVGATAAAVNATTSTAVRAVIWSTSKPECSWWKRL
jgi:hypothetical protein